MDSPGSYAEPFIDLSQVYNLAMERKKQLEAIHEDGYHMPDSYDDPRKHASRYDVAKQRYAEPEDPEQANPFAEQEKWEAEQLRRHMKVGDIDFTLPLMFG